MEKQDIRAKQERSYGERWHRAMSILCPNHLGVCEVKTQTVQIACKFCGSKDVVRFGLKDEIQYYMCRACGRKFAGTDAPPGMRYDADQIAAAVGMFYEGLSLTAIQRQLQAQYGLLPSDSTIYEWIARYTKVAIEAIQGVKVSVGDFWIADETVLEIDGKNIWFWDVIDDKTRFLLASHLSGQRTTQDAQVLMERACIGAGKAPNVIITDKLRAYLDGIERVFGADTKHLQSKGFRIEPNTNLIERFHGTLKARTKVMRGLKSMDTARLFMGGWLVHYNFFRPHEALGGKPPCVAAKACVDFRNWGGVVRQGWHRIRHEVST